MPITHPDYSNLNHEEMAGFIGLQAKHIPMLLESFLQETAVSLSQLESALDSLNLTEIESCAHSIKGSAGNLRLQEIYEMAQELELAAKASQNDFSYREYFDAIKKAVETIKL